MIHGKKSRLATIDNDKIEVGGPAVTEEECHHRVRVPPVAVRQQEGLPPTLADSGSRIASYFLPILT